MHRLAFPFATLRQPGGESFRETFGSEPETCFEAAIGKGQGVVEISGIREVAHAELVQPVERTGFLLTANDDIHLKFLRVHGEMIAPRAKSCRA